MNVFKDGDVCGGRWEVQGRSDISCCESVCIETVW